MGDESILPAMPSPGLQAQQQESQNSQPKRQARVRGDREKWRSQLQIPALTSVTLNTSPPQPSVQEEIEPSLTILDSSLGPGTKEVQLKISSESSRKKKKSKKNKKIKIDTDTKKVSQKLNKRMNFAKNFIDVDAENINTDQKSEINDEFDYLLKIHLNNAKQPQKIPKKRKRNDNQSNSTQTPHKKLACHSSFSRDEPQTPHLKKLPCHAWAKGTCHREECPFSHDGPKGVPPSKNILCKYFTTNSCAKGEACVYSHDLSIEPCTFYFLNGVCQNGSSCPFSHEPLTEETHAKVTRTSKPCMFYHMKGYCTSGLSCVYSHTEPTEEQMENLKMRYVPSKIDVMMATKGTTGKIKDEIPEERLKYQEEGLGIVIRELRYSESIELSLPDGHGAGTDHKLQHIPTQKECWEV